VVIPEIAPAAADKIPKEDKYICVVFIVFMLKVLLSVFSNLMIFAQYISQLPNHIFGFEQCSLTFLITKNI